MPSKRKEAQNAKRKRGRKKIVLLIVEGQSDVEALAEPLANTLYEFDSEMEFYPLYLGDKLSQAQGTDERGDVTSKYGVTPTTIEHVIDKLYLQPFFHNRKNPSFYPKDIAMIAHVVDTDGTFIPDDCVIQAPDGFEGHEYREDCIVTSGVEDIIKRNEQKAENIRHLVGINTITTGFDKRKRAMPYGVYFFSSNLDHYLHGDANLDRYQKVSLAREFADKCCLRPSLFFDTVQGDEDFSQCSYAESWERIQTGCCSLQSHTNLGLLIESLQGLSV